jgi:hypothetical protein
MKRTSPILPFLISLSSPSKDLKVSLKVPVSWLRAVYSPRLPGQSPVAETFQGFKVSGSRLKDFLPFLLAPNALRLAISRGFRSLHSCGAAGDSHPLPLEPSGQAFLNLLQ